MMIRVPSYVLTTLYLRPKNIKMKKTNLFLLLTLISGSIIFSSCNDDTDDDPGVNNACKIMSSSDDDGETIAYTYDGDDLVKMVETDSFGSFTTNFLYEGGKLVKVEEGGSTIYEVIYNGSNISRVNIRDFTDNELYEYILYTFTNGVVSKMDLYEIDEDTQKDSITESYDITFNGDNLSKVDILELDDDGNLIASGSINVTGFDDKINPFYMFPTMASSDYDDFSFFSKNNITSASLVTPFGTLPFSMTYEYNAEGYPTKMVASALGETTTTTMTYDCK
jgi:YD repeat-containing protein